MSHLAPNTVHAAIIDSADQLFERYGYRKTTVEEVAHAAGIGKGTIYLHFRSKEEIGLAWVDRLHLNLYDQLVAIARCDASPEARLVAFLEQRVILRYDLFDRHKRSMDEAMESLRPQLIGKRDAFHEGEAQLLKSVIEDGVQAGLMQSADPATDARSMILATNSLLPYSLRPEQLGDRGCVFGKVASLARLLVRAVHPAPPTQT